VLLTCGDTVARGIRSALDGGDEAGTTGFRRRRGV